MTNIKIRTRQSAVTYLRRPFPVAFSTLKSYVSDRDGFRAYVHRDVLEFIKQEAQRAGDDETVGLLTGRICQDPVHGPYTLVMAADGAREGEFEATPSHVKLLTGGHAKVRHRLESAHPDREIIGWYHSHPHCAAQFSSVDIKEQVTWTDPNHIGIVYSGVDELEPFGFYRGPSAVPLRPTYEDPEVIRRQNDTCFLPPSPKRQLTPRPEPNILMRNTPTSGRSTPFKALVARPKRLLMPGMTIILLVVVGTILWLNRRVSLVEAKVLQLTNGKTEVRKELAEPAQSRSDERRESSPTSSPPVSSEKAAVVDSPELAAQAKPLVPTTTPQPQAEKGKADTRHLKRTQKARKRSKPQVQPQKQRER